MNKNEIMSKTKIVCTIGPASESKEMLTKLVKAGMNVMRLNFSHGTHEEHEEKINTLLEINKELSTNVAILLDTKGPEIRTGDFVGGKTTFKKGQTSTICVEDIEGTSERFTITYKDLYKDVKPGGFILVNDGQVELLVDHVDGTDIVCICAKDGVVKNIHITLKYGEDKNEKIITGLKRISKPGLRVYAGKEELPKVLGGLGIAILSTNKGVITDKEARKLQVGGEVLAFVW